MPPSADAFREAFAGSQGARRPLLVLDSFELVEAGARRLLEELLPALPAGSTLLVASRNPPGEIWFEAGLGERLMDLRLGPISESAARGLLAAEGSGEHELLGQAQQLLARLAGQLLGEQAVIMVAVLVVGRNPGGRRPPPGTKPRRRTRGSLSGQAERERAIEAQPEVEAHDIDQMLAARDALRQRMGRPSLSDFLSRKHVGPPGRKDSPTSRVGF